MEQGAAPAVPPPFPMAMIRVLRGLAVALALVLSLAGPARAQGEGGPLSALATANFDELSRAIERLALSGHPQALPIVEALRDGRLMFRQEDRAIFWRDSAGAMRDAATGEVAPGVAAGALRAHRLNNRVRRAIEAAVGALSLSNADPRVRLAAAERVFRSRDPEAIPALDAQLARERRTHCLRPVPGLEGQRGRVRQLRRNGQRHLHRFGREPVFLL